MILNQRDQIGRFLQVLGNKLYHKGNPTILMPFGAITNTVTFMEKLCGYFLAIFWGN